MRQRGQTMTSVSAGHIILTTTQPIGRRRPQRESNPGPPLQMQSRALPTKLPKLCNIFEQPFQKLDSNYLYLAGH